MQQDEHVETIAFDPDSGFGARKPLLASTMLLDVEPFGNGSLLLLTRFRTTQYDVAFIDADGEIRTHSPLFFTPEPQHPYATVGTSAAGPLFFFSRALGESWSTGASICSHIACAR